MKENFGWPRIADQYLQMYQKALRCEK